MTNSPPATPSDIYSLLGTRTKDLPSSAYSYKLAGTGNSAQFALDVISLEEPVVDEARMSIVIPFADGNRRDGVGDLLEVGGIVTERHVKNPIVLWDHGKVQTLPIGLATDPQTGEYCVYIDPTLRTAKLKAFLYQGKGLAGVERDQEYAHAVFCEQIFDLWRKKFIRGGSIGYQVQQASPLQADYSQGIPQGLHLIRTLMLEGSAVVMPAHMDTVGKSLPDNSARQVLCMGGVCGKPLSPVLVKSLQQFAGDKPAVLGWEPRGKSLPRSGEKRVDRVVPPEAPDDEGPLSVPPEDAYYSSGLKFPEPKPEKILPRLKPHGERHPPSGEAKHMGSNSDGGRSVAAGPRGSNGATTHNHNSCGCGCGGTCGCSDAKGMEHAGQNKPKGPKERQPAHNSSEFRGHVPGKPEKFTRPLPTRPRDIEGRAELGKDLKSLRAYYRSKGAAEMKVPRRPNTGVGGASKEEPKGGGKRAYAGEGTSVYGGLGVGATSRMQSHLDQETRKLNRSYRESGEEPPYEDPIRNRHGGQKSVELHGDMDVYKTEEVPLPLAGKKAHPDLPYSDKPPRNPKTPKGGNEVAVEGGQLHHTVYPDNPQWSHANMAGDRNTAQRKFPKGAKSGVLNAREQSATTGMSTGYANPLSNSSIPPPHSRQSWLPNQKLKALRHCYRSKNIPKCEGCGVRAGTITAVDLGDEATGAYQLCHRCARKLESLHREPMDAQRVQSGRAVNQLEKTRAEKALGRRIAGALAGAAAVCGAAGCGASSPKPAATHQARPAQTAPARPRPASGHPSVPSYYQNPRFEEAGTGGAPAPVPEAREEPEATHAARPKLHAPGEKAIIRHGGRVVNPARRSEVAREGLRQRTAREAEAAAHIPEEHERAVPPVAPPRKYKAPKEGYGRALPAYPPKGAKVGRPDYADAPPTPARAAAGVTPEGYTPASEQARRRQVAHRLKLSRAGLQEIKALRLHYRSKAGAFRRAARQLAVPAAVGMALGAPVGMMGKIATSVHRQNQAAAAARAASASEPLVREGETIPVPREPEPPGGGEAAPPQPANPPAPVEPATKPPVAAQGYPADKPAGASEAGAAKPMVSRGAPKPAAGAVQSAGVGKGPGHPSVYHQGRVTYPKNPLSQQVYSQRAAAAKPSQHPPQGSAKGLVDRLPDRSGRERESLSGGTLANSSLGTEVKRGCGGKSMLEAGTWAKSLETRRKYRPSADGLRRRLKSSRDGRTLVYVREKDVKGCGDMAKRMGLGFSVLGKHPSGHMRVALEGSDGPCDAVAVHYGRKVKGLVDQLPDQSGRERESLSNGTLANSELGTEVLRGTKSAKPRANQVRSNRVHDSESLIGGQPSPHMKQTGRLPTSHAGPTELSGTSNTARQRVGGKRTKLATPGDALEEAQKAMPRKNKDPLRTQRRTGNTDLGNYSDSYRNQIGYLENQQSAIMKQRMTGNRGAVTDQPPKIRHEAKDMDLVKIDCPDHQTTSEQAMARSRAGRRGKSLAALRKHYRALGGNQ